jgi:Ca-activated chloride channel family protein
VETLTRFERLKQIPKIGVLIMRKANFLLWILVCAAAASLNVLGQDVTEGTLFASNSRGKQLGACPLKNTAVDVEISGFVARVRVVQDFQNTFSVPIEAVYTFPLSQNSAVDEMTMTVGTRTIRSKIMKREEARKVYETAKADGKTASLLDQERANIFTQSVANIMPGESVKIEISYVETLKYEDGEYEFVFPMTMGRKYIPGSVVDAAKISPPIANRPGHDISINVKLNAGVPVEAIRSTSHEVDQLNYSPASAKVNLRSGTTIPNKDFILRYDVTGKRIEDALIAHRSERGGFFTLVLQPPDKIASEDRTPKEIVFVLDTSGSMSGFPIEKAKEAMKLSLDGLYPEDTFNLITFAGDTSVLFEKPVPATQENLELAQEFLASRRGYGGTEMMTAIRAAFAPSGSTEHLRIVCFMTDAEVGNEDEIIAEIQRNQQARVFSFGIGNSVNRALLDKMAEAGRGEVEYVSLTDDGSKAAKRFYERVRSPLLTDLSIEWNGMPVADVYPSKLGDLFSAKPVIVKGRYLRGAKGTIKLKGTFAGSPYERSIEVTLPETEAANDSLASLWARQRIDELSSDALNAEDPSTIENQITDLGLEFRLMTMFTSFVAVEDRIVNRSGQGVKVEVPVGAPDGVDSEMITSDVEQGDLASQTKSGIRPARAKVWRSKNVAHLMSPPSAQGSASYSSGAGRGGGTGTGYGTGSGSGNGSGSGSGGAPPPIPRQVSGGVMNGKAVSLPKPAYPSAASSVGASGSVSVQVTIDESGKVVSAVPVSGHPLLRAAATQAASGATFTPTMMSGQPVKVTGVITYNFGTSGTTIVANPGEPVGPLTPSLTLTPQEIRDRLHKKKLHRWLYAVLQKNSSPTPNESTFVRDGEASISLTLTKPATTDLLETLKALGFESLKLEGTSITGTIAVEKLRELADVEEIKYILPRAIDGH